MFECSAAVVAELWQLAHTPFRRWEAAGWEVQPSCSAYDWVAYWVLLPNDLKLEVFPGGERIYGVDLTLCLNGDRHRVEFDACFQGARELAVAELGSPLHEGTDHSADEQRNYAVWRGNTGVLVLQQDSIDFHRGGQVAFWLLPLRSYERPPERDLQAWTERKISERL
jgi:hypothetical protein